MNELGPGRKRLSNRCVNSGIFLRYFGVAVGCISVVGGFGQWDWLRCEPAYACVEWAFGLPKVNLALRMEGPLISNVKMAFLGVGFIRAYRSGRMIKREKIGIAKGVDIEVSKRIWGAGCGWGGRWPGGGGAIFGGPKYRILGTDDDDRPSNHSPDPSARLCIRPNFKSTDVSTTNTRIKYHH